MIWVRTKTPEEKKQEYREEGKKGKLNYTEIPHDDNICFKTLLFPSYLYIIGKWNVT